MEQQGTDSPGAALPSVGGDLRKAREAAGLSRADIAMQTKIAERHLLAIEENRLSDLAARTYAVGFTRAYARALGLDEKSFAERAREQLDAAGGMPQRTLEPSFEPGDPARVPSLRIVAWAAVAVLAVVIAVWAAGSTFLSPESKLPSLLPVETATVAPAKPAAVVAPMPTASAITSPAPAAPGSVPSVVPSATPSAAPPTSSPRPRPVPSREARPVPAVTPTATSVAPSAPPPGEAAVPAPVSTVSE